MTTATPPVAHAGLDFLGKAALVLLTFQAGGLAHMMVVRGLDGPPNGYLSLVMLAALFAGTQRRLARAQVARGAVAWFTASRAAVFAVLAIASALVVFDGLATPPARDVTYHCHCRGDVGGACAQRSGGRPVQTGRLPGPARLLDDAQQAGLG